MNDSLRSFLLLSLCLVLLSCSGCFQSSSDSQSVITIDGKGEFTKLSVALHAAEPGDTLFFSAGTFPVDSLVNTSVKLKGSGMDKTILSTSKSYNPSVITLQSDHCTIENLTIKGTGATTHGITLSSSYNKLSHISFSKCYYGLYVLEGSVENNCSQLMISNCSYGCFLKFSNGNRFDQCTFSSCDYYGMFLSYSSKTSIDNCSFTSCKEYGLYVDTGSDKSVIDSCSFSQNAHGARLKSVSGCHCRNSLFLENDVGAILCCGSDHNSFYDNAFIDNTVQATDEIGNNWSFDGRGNYWSDLLVDYPSAEQQNGIWDVSYEVSDSGWDHYPLVQNPLS